MEKCPYCSTEIIDELNFCIECERQVKCLNCGAALYKNKTRCLRCGTFLKINSEATEATNSYVLEEKITKDESFRRIEVKASDNAVDAFAAKLPIGNGNRLRTLDNNTSIANSTNNFLPPLIESEEDILESEPPPNYSGDLPKQDSTFSNELVDWLFSEHSEYLRVPSKTLRDYLKTLTTKKETQQVFALLYVWVINQVKERSVKRDELIAVMKHEGLYDKNSNKHLGELIKNYFVVNNTEYRVNDYDGKTKVDAIINDIRNPKPKQSSSSTQNTKSPGRPRGSVNKKEIGIVQPWLELPLDSLDNFDIRKLNSAKDWGLFAIYVLTKVLKVQDTIEPGIAYTFLSQKYSTLNIKRANFRDTLGKDTKNLSKSVSGAYSLTKVGEQKIKMLIEGSSS